MGFFLFNYLVNSPLIERNFSIENFIVFSSNVSFLRLEGKIKMSVMRLYLAIQLNIDESISTNRTYPSF
jgi:hypothetical protein